MTQKTIDKNEIIFKLNKNHLLHSKWYRCLRVRIGYKCCSILQTIIETGHKCTLSTPEITFILGMDQRTFRIHRQELIDLKVISYKRGNSFGNANEYFKCHERIAELIKEGEQILADKKLNIKDDNIYNLPRQNNPSFIIPEKSI